MLISTSAHARKGKTRRDQATGAHHRNIVNRNACKFRSSATDCADCPTKSHQTDKVRRK